MCILYFFPSSANGGDSVMCPFYRMQLRYTCVVVEKKIALGKRQRTLFKVPKCYYSFEQTRHKKVSSSASFMTFLDLGLLLQSKNWVFACDFFSVARPISYRIACKQATLCPLSCLFGIPTRSQINTSKQFFIERNWKPFVVHPKGDSNSRGPDIPFR